MIDQANNVFARLAKLRATNPEDADAISAFIEVLSAEFETMAGAISAMRDQQEVFELSTRAGIISQTGEVADLRKRVTELEQACGTAAFALANKSPELALRAIQNAVPGAGSGPGPGRAKSKQK